MAKFQSYARPEGFNPIRVPDETQKYLAQGQQQLQAMQRAANFDLANRDRYLSAMQNMQQIESQNREAVFRRDESNRRAIQDQVLGNYNITIENARLQGQQELATLKAVSAFSNTAFEAIQTFNQKREDAIKLGVQNTIFNLGLDTRTLVEFNKIDRNLSDQALGENEFIKGLIERGGSIQEIRYLMKHSNAKYWIENKELLTQAGTVGYANYFTANLETKYQTPKGEMSYAEALQQNDLETQELIRNQIREAFSTEYQLDKYSPQAVESFTNPGIRAYNAQLVSQSNAAFKKSSLADAENTALKLRLDVISTYGGAEAARRIQDAPSGQPRRNEKDGFIAAFVAGAQTPQWREYEAQANTFLSSIPQEHWDSRYFQITEAYKDARKRAIQDTQIVEAETNANITAWTNNAINELQQLPDVVAADVDAVIERFTNIPEFAGKPIPTELETFRQNNTVDGKFIRAKQKQVQQLDDAGVLTTDMIIQLGLPNSAVSGEIRARAAARTKAQQDDPKFSSVEKALVDLAKTPAQVQSKVQGLYDPSVGLMGDHLMGQFRREFNNLELAKPGDPTNANNAYSIVRDRFYNDIKNPAFFVNRGTGLGGYAQFNRPANVDKEAAIRGARIQNVIATKGVKALDIPGAILSVPELEKIKADAIKPGFTPDARITGIARQLGMNPVAVLDRLMQSNDLGRLPVAQFFTQFRQQADPALLRKLDAYQTERISTRAMGSTGTYDPNRVPTRLGYNLGELIQNAANKYKLPVGVLAGLLHHESGGFAEDVLTGKRVSRNSKGEIVGALGIAQFMPGTAAGMGIDPLNIPQAIDGAARYLSGLISHPNNPGRSLNWAIQAYNSGPGAVGQSQENREFFGKVMSQAYRYGHLQSLQSPSTMRPSMQRFGVVPFERPSSVNFESSSGQPGVDLYFESKRFPAVLGGVVKDVSREPGYGNYVVIESVDPMTGQKVDVLYGHLADGLTLRPGQSIQAGDIIGTQGGTGNVRSVDGTIASIDFLAPAARGSKSMTPYSNFDRLRRYVVSQLQR